MRNADSPLTEEFDLFVMQPPVLSRVVGLSVLWSPKHHGPCTAHAPSCVGYVQWAERLIGEVLYVLCVVVHSGLRPAEASRCSSHGQSSWQGGLWLCHRVA